jgi:YesN/AraC family two-component response regulator
MRNILFLDDEESILNMYKRLLRGSEFNCFFAHNVTEAKNIIETQKIDLVVSDYRLEQETGLDFIKQMRERNIKIPMIILSGYAEEEFVKKALELSIVQDFVLKPISSNDLRSVLNKYLKQEML